jgi:NAD(P)-dependent dehydrogenase (short-subunit alcohol dehydrogenase family)
MSRKLEGKVAIVTGGASGIGLATVRRFVEEGANVVMADVQDDRGHDVVKEFGAEVAYVHTDVASEADVENVVAQAVARFGKLDVMYNNAGTGGGAESILDLEPAHLDQVIAVNVRSVALGHKYAAKQFLSQGGGGAIVTTASTSGLEGGWGPSAYTISKHAVVGLVRQAVYDFGANGIRTNVIAVGTVMTPLYARTFGVPAERAEEFMAYLSEALKGDNPIGRVGQPVDIANVAVFLASDESSFMTGAVVAVDGGATAVTQGTVGPDVVRAATEFNALHALSV